MLVCPYVQGEVMRRLALAFHAAVSAPSECLYVYVCVLVCVG